MSYETMPKANQEENQTTQNSNNAESNHVNNHHVQPHAQEKQIKVKRKGRKGCVFAVIGCLVLLIFLIGGVAGGVALYSPVKDYLVQHGILKDSTTSVTSSSSDQKKISYNQSDQEISDSKTVDIVKSAMTSAVSIALTTNSPSTKFGSAVNSTQVIGSGFIVDKDNGYVVTNQHVACNLTTTTGKVITSNDKTYSIKQIYQDQGDDLAVLQLDTSTGALPSQLTLSTSAVQVGQMVIAIGNPSGFTGSVSTGVLSGIGRNITASGECLNATTSKDYVEVYQTDAAINPGNSGGPLLNSLGQVIAVNSATSTDAQNISFSIPIDRVIRKLEELKKFGTFKNPFIGVTYEIVDSVSAQTYNLPQGAYVDSVLPAGPAGKAGIKVGDVITSINDKKINFSLIGVVSQFNVGDTVKVAVVRQDAQTKQNSTLTFNLTLLDRSDFNQ